MELTQTELDAAINAAVAAYTGQRLAYSGFPGECLSEIKLIYSVILGVPMPSSPNGWGDGYYEYLPSPLDKYFTKEVFNPNKSYPKGSIFVYPATHHIVILLASYPGTNASLVFEQNADPDGSPAHQFLRPNTTSTRAVTGVMVPIVKSEGVEEMIDTDDKAIELFIAMFHDVPSDVTQDAINSIKGQSYSVVIPVLQGYAKWKDQNDKLVAYPQLQASVQKLQAQVSAATDPAIKASIQELITLLQAQK